MPCKATIILYCDSDGCDNFFLKEIKQPVSPIESIVLAFQESMDGGWSSKPDTKFLKFFCPKHTDLANPSEPMSVE